MSGERGGLILENHYQMGETLNGAGELDIDAEKKVVDQKLDDLRIQGATENEIKLAMKDFGIERLVKIYPFLINHLSISPFFFSFVCTIKQVLMIL